MEAIAATSEGKWGSFCGTFVAEEADFIAQFLNSSSVPNEINDCSMSVPSVFWPFHDSAMNTAGFADNSYLSLDFASSRFCSFSEGSSYGGESLGQQSYYMCDPQQILTSINSPISMDSSSYLINGDECMYREFSEGNAGQCAGNMPEAALLETGVPKPDPISEVKSNKPSEISKKRCLNSGYVRKNERITQSKKQQKLSSISEIERAGNPGLVGQSSSSSCSEDDSNASPELEGEETPSLGTKGPAALNSKGKTRAGRGSASDPQSVYARKKREKINERLRTLQNLVPHGTKVDITTMLEEAVEYVKFLQLQIKLLSSNDLWMYAPIAYNGMDIGLDRKVTVLNNL